MASAALDNLPPPPTDHSSSPSPLAWLPPRISFSFDVPADDPTAPNPSPPPPRDPNAPHSPDFEFLPPSSLHPPLPPADELISHGKLLPLHLPAAPPPPPPSSPPHTPPSSSPPPPNPNPNPNPSPDPSPKAPRCSARLRELLRLNRRRRLLHRDSSSSTPLLPTSTRSSSSSSSSDDSNPHPLPPRLSLDSDKPSSSTSAASTTNRPGRPHSRAAPVAAASASRGASVDSPRVNPSGKVVFERSSSTPGSFAGGGGGGHHRPRPRAIERSYSTNVRVAPVINVFGFAPLFSPSSAPQRKDREKSRRRASKGEPA